MSQHLLQGQGKIGREGKGQRMAVDYGGMARWNFCFCWTPKPGQEHPQQYLGLSVLNAS